MSLQQKLITRKDSLFKKLGFLPLIFFLLLHIHMVSQEDSPGEIKREKAFQDIGDVFQVAIPVGAAAGTLFMKDEEGFWQLTKSYATTIAITYAAKYIIDKPRPDGATDGHAFPSGHTSSAFSGASFIQRRYGWKYGVPAYALAGFVAFSRVEGLHDRHDTWDVLVGALVGIGSTYVFTTPYSKNHFEFSFANGRGEYLVGVIFKF